MNLPKGSGKKIRVAVIAKDEHKAKKQQKQEQTLVGR